MEKNLPEIIHVHIPKTGGKWLDKTLTAVIPEHYPYAGFHSGFANPVVDLMEHVPVEYQVDKRPFITAVYKGKEAEQPGRFKAATKLSICRNPYDLLVSYYHHSESHHYRPEYLQLSGPTGWASINVVHGIRSFDGFIKRYCDPQFRWHHSLRQKNLFFQMYGETGKCEVDVIVRQEMLFAGIKTFLAAVGYCQENALEPYREKVNASSRKKDCRHYYTDELRELVTEKCAAELSDFGYDFDGPINLDAFVDPTILSNRTFTQE